MLLQHLTTDTFIRFRCHNQVLHVTYTFPQQTNHLFNKIPSTYKIRTVIKHLKHRNKERAKERQDGKKNKRSDKKKDCWKEK